MITSQERRLIEIFKSAIASRLMVLQYSHTAETHAAIKHYIDHDRAVATGCGCIALLGRGGLHEALQAWVASKEANICAPSRWPGRTAKIIGGSL